MRERRFQSTSRNGPVPTGCSIARAGLPCTISRATAPESAGVAST